MPIPSPRPDEEHDDFINRCMSNDTIEEDFPDPEQRFVVCQQSWEDK